MPYLCKLVKAGPGVLFLSIALAACGGGGGAEAPAAKPPPVVVAKPDIAEAGIDKPTTLSVLSNDSGTALKLISATVPAHGSAAIVGDTIVYTPTAGFFGTDSFSYTAQDAAASAATSQAQVTVNVSAALTLSGKTEDLPAGSEVTITIGSRAVKASTDASGNFSAPVSFDSPASMVSVTAQGSGAKSYIKLISLVGDSQGAVNAAGAAKTLDMIALPGLHVTAITTAIYAHAIRRNGGAVPATQLALDQACADIGVPELTQTAATIRAITGKAGAAPARALPSNASDTLDLVTNTAMYTSFVKMITPERTYADMEALAKDSALASVPLVGLGTGKSLVLYRNTACCANAAMELVIDANGGGSAARELKRWSGSWQKDGALTLTLAVPWVREEWVALSETEMVRVQYVTEQIEMRQISGTAVQGFAMLTYRGKASYPNRERADAAYSAGQLFAFRDWNSVAAPADLAGVVLAGVPNLSYPAENIPSQIVLALAADGRASSAQLPGSAIGWKVTNGKLALDFAGLGGITMGRVSVNADGDQRWLIRAPVGDDYTVYEATIVQPQAALAFTEASAMHNWSEAPTSNYVGPTTLVRVLAQHIALYEAQNLDGSLAGSWQNTWSIEDGKLLVRSYNITATGQQVAVCPQGTPCTLQTERSWTLLRSGPNSIVVLDGITWNSGESRHYIIRFGHG
jgi:hypothetical protein